MNSAERPSVAVLGAGTMGAAMARNLVDAGFDLHVWNRTADRAREVATQGERASAAATPREAAEGCALVITMLSDGDAVESVVTGDEGALAAMGSDQVWLQMSTVGVDAIERLAQLAADAGVPFVDAPVSGTKEPAERGELLVLASGPRDSLERARAVFDVVGAKTFELGEAGAGTRLKLVLNTWLVGLVEALAETIAFAEGIGADPRRFLEAIDGGPLGPAYAQLKGSAMLDRKFPPSFALKLARKDAGLVEAAAEREGVSVPIVEVIARQMDRAIELGHGDEDMAATIFASAR